MPTRIKTVKSPSLKADIIADIKERLVEEMKSDLLHFRKEMYEEDDFLKNRIEKLESLYWEEKTSKLSISDWCMISCYIVIIIGTVVVTVRTLKKTSTYGHS